jgi:hypothetical protein
MWLGRAPGPNHHEKLKDLNTIFQQPKNTMPRIESVYAFLSVDAEDGNEGVVGAPMGALGCVPLIAADEQRLEQLRQIAQAISNRSKAQIRLVKFTKREEIGFIQPVSPGR